MDCNKEEAMRAKALAEDLMQNGDFTGAQKLVMKAQSLFSGLESLPQMLAICDVHAAAEEKLDNLDNWYGILQVMHFADDATIKKQYKKLALLLHPDKNQFPGAEAAFKLIVQANGVLADKERQLQYDNRYRYYSRLAGKQLNANSVRQRGSTDNASETVVNNGTFWTCCEHCGYRYKYLAEYMNILLFCSSCQRSFMAYNTGFDAVPPKSSTDQKEGQNQGPCNTFAHRNVESTGAQPGNAEAGVDKDKKQTVKEELNKKDEGRKTKIEDEPVKNYADVLNPGSKFTKPETYPLKSVAGESVSRSVQAPSLRKDKSKSKRKKIVEEPIESINVDVSDTVERKVDSKEKNRRKNPRERQQKPFAEEGSSDDFVRAPTKKSKVSVGSSKRPDSGDSFAPSFAYKGKDTKNVDSGCEEISSTKIKEGKKGCEESGEAVMAGKIGINHQANENLIAEDSPDPDFNNFEPTTSCFAVNQVWSLYDPIDGMPRFYARINKVVHSEFKLWTTWLYPLQDNKDNSIPIACGIFQDGETEEVADHLMFSSQILHLPRDKNTIIYPRKGEVWALFRGWNITWGSSSVNHQRPYEYDYVEVLSNFKDKDGVGVAYLGKVEGFVSLFCQDTERRVLQHQIPPSEMLRFSHKAPSFKMTGKEREGVPPGCFELDTAALPKEMFEVDDSKVDVELDRKKPNGKTVGPFAEASEVEVQVKTTRNKRQKVHDNHGLSSKASGGECNNREMNSQKKSRKSVKAMDDLKLRKSPRRLSKTKKQATSTSRPNLAEKKRANSGESHGQPDEFCVSGEKMAIPKKPMITTDSSRVRGTRQDIVEPTGKSKECERNDELLSQSEENGLLTRLNGDSKCSVPEAHVESRCTTGQENTFNFENQRSWDKFQLNQVWAIYSNANGMPRTYAQIKVLDTSPEFKLHVAPLELYRPPKNKTRPTCCGCFKLKIGIADVLVPSSFSHQVKAVKTNKNKFEVYPGKDEIWALYKNLTTTDGAETEELEIVHVVETDEQSIRAAPLTAKDGFNKPLYRRSDESKTCFIDIPKTEVSRFSHQIPAFKHERRATRFGDGDCWELDVKAVP